jgi:hypothetical protein
MRFRPTMALFLAYALTLASVLGAVSSASLAGTSHIQQCVTSVEDGKPLPAHSGDHNLCCLAAQAQPSGLAPAPVEISAPAIFSSEKLSPLAFKEIAGTEIISGDPRAPPSAA